MRAPPGSLGQPGRASSTLDLPSAVRRRLDFLTLGRHLLSLPSLRSTEDLVPIMQLFREYRERDHCGMGSHLCVRPACAEVIAVH